MEKDIVNLIAEAEGKAQERKAIAQAEATEILSAAEARASEIAKESELSLAHLREETLLQAEAEARADYEAALAARRSEAKKYADSLLENTEIYVTDIVGRITK